MYILSPSADMATASPPAFEWVMPSKPDPLWAAGLEVAPHALWLGWAITDWQHNWSQPQFFLPFLTTSMGYTYAGDPLRGLLMTVSDPLVSYGAGLVGGLAVAALATPFVPPDPISGARTGALGVGMVGAIVCGVLAHAGVIGWEAYEAYQIAKRKSDRAAGTGMPTP